MISEQVVAIGRESTTMATARSTGERRQLSKAKKRPAASARPDAGVQRVAQLFREVSEPSRLPILLALADGPMSTRQLCERMGQSETEVSHHLALLRASKVVDSRREGKETRHQLTEQGSRFLNSALGLLDEADPAPEPRISKSELKKLIKKVGSVVGDPEDWLNSPNPRFEGRRPIDLIGTDDEIRVHIIIEAAQQGCFS
jgi:DNA-binding transcriptional ArsR family regulator